MTKQGVSRNICVAAVQSSLLIQAYADPCGMVPPVFTGAGPAITRIGAQRTYIFYKDGVETFVIRPGFSGKVDEFGMLIPFPSVPAIRKVPDDIFAHIAAAVDPPEVLIYNYILENGAFRRGRHPRMDKLGFSADEVRVIREEAVGMYQVVVLDAGSAQALKRWMDDRGYKYPNGMDAACQDYVDLGWCFVAVKARVGQKRGVDPKPGMREVDSKLPPGATFDGYVQGMGFRFRVPELVVPMRLSAFNKGELHNIVYVLTDRPCRIKHIPREYVVRQIPGEELYDNVTRPLPVRLIGGGDDDEIPEWWKRNLPAQRDPVPHNGIARDLFASDLLASKSRRLSHHFEEAEKELLRIGEQLGLRGPEIDKLNSDVLEEHRKDVVDRSLADLKGMTLTVIDGDFPREILARENLTFRPFAMAEDRNKPEFYDAKHIGPAPKVGGKLLGLHGFQDQGSRFATRLTVAIALLALVAGCCCSIVRNRRSKGGIHFFLALLMSGSALCQRALAQEPTLTDLILQLDHDQQSQSAVQKLIERGDEAVPVLLDEALRGQSLFRRGWCIVCLAEIEGDGVSENLRRLSADASQPPVVRNWAAAACVKRARTIDDLVPLAPLVGAFPSLMRPLSRRVRAVLKTSPEPPSVEQVLSLCSHMPRLQSALMETVLSSGAEELVKTMTTAPDQDVRRTAAAFLASLGARSYEEVAQAVIAAYRFNPEAGDVPWAGGPLFVPAINWQTAQARQLVSNLIAWYVFCDWTGRKEEKRQIHNNLRSIQLARAAGYTTPGRQDPGVEPWLLAWGRAAGKAEIEKILGSQGVTKEYVHILEQL